MIYFRECFAISGTGVARKWRRPQMHALSADFRALALDLLGHGALSIEPVITAGLYPNVAIDAFFEISGKNFYRMLQSYSGLLLLANGENDKINRKAEKVFLRTIPRTKSYPIQGASHLTNLEPELFSQAIRGFAGGLTW